MAQTKGEPPDDEVVRIRRWRCEHLEYIPKFAGFAYCGKPGRWLVGRQIRCGEHKEEKR